MHKTVFDLMESGMQTAQFNSARYVVAKFVRRMHQHDRFHKIRQLRALPVAERIVQNSGTTRKDELRPTRI